jgi:hypothetical protein
MANLVDTVLVRSDLLSLSDKITYAVEQGGSAITVQSFGASASSSSNHVYSVQVPSVSTVMSRNVKWRCRVAYTISGTVPPKIGANDGFLIQYGTNCVLAPFPLNQACLTSTAQINNASFSVNTREVLDPLLRQCDRRQLGLWSATTPTMLDNATPYASSAAYANSPFQSFPNAFELDNIPRGAFNIVSITGNAANTGGAAVPGTVVLTVDLSEPLVGLSPFVWGEHPDEACGMNNLSQINVSMSLDSVAQRSVRVINAATDNLGTGLAITQVQYSACYLDVEFHTPPPECFLPPTTALPYMSIQNYQTPAGATVAYQTTSTINSNVITLSSVPDKLLLFVRQQQGLLKPTDADCYAAITSVSILWNNSSGILSNAPTSMLWKYSRESGSKQNWVEFQGFAQLPQVLAGGNTTPQTNTVGSVLALDFSRVIPIAGLQTCGSLGSFNFSIKVDFTNTTGFDMSAPILNCCFLSSGVVMLNQGTAQSFVGVLDKETVLEAYKQEATPNAELKRVVGGGFFDRLKTIAHKAYTFGRRHGPAALEMARRHGVIDEAKHRLAQHSAVGKKAASAISALGYGVGEEMGGAFSGGRKHLKHRLY